MPFLIESFKDYLNNVVLQKLQAILIFGSAYFCKNVLIELYSDELFSDRAVFSSNEDCRLM